MTNSVSTNVIPSFVTTKQDRINELTQKKAINTKKEIGANTSIALGCMGGMAAVNKYAYYKFFTWNKVINNFAKKIVNSPKEFFGSNTIKKYAKNFSKTSGRQKLLMAVPIVAAGTALAVTHYFGKQNGKIESELKRISR